MICAHCLRFGASGKSGQKNLLPTWVIDSRLWPPPADAKGARLKRPDLIGTDFRIQRWINSGSSTGSDESTHRSLFRFFPLSATRPFATIFPVCRLRSTQVHGARPGLPRKWCIPRIPRGSKPATQFSEHDQHRRIPSPRDASCYLRNRRATEGNRRFQSYSARHGYNVLRPAFGPVAERPILHFA